MLYGVVCYAVGVAALLYAVGFVGDLDLPKTIDSGPAGAAGPALLVDAALLTLFGLQHTVMARPRFKQWWTRFIAPSVERSTYVLLSGLALALLMWQWQPLPQVMWDAANPILRGALQTFYWMGWAMAAASTFMINHFDLLGLRQVYLRARGAAYTEVPFQVIALYRFVRHPIMLGMLLAFWSTPRMTVGHFVFALGMTIYIFIGVFFEERDLAAAHGASYEGYRSQVPMIVPVPGRRAR